MKGLQEKFQTILRPQPGEDDGNEWTTAASARRAQSFGANLNQMPTGMELPGMNPFERSIAGSTDFSQDATLQAFDKGYTRRPMNGSDDQYTGEHIDHFYGEAVDAEGNVGFAERNNYLDRE